MPFQPWYPPIKLGLASGSVELGLFQEAPHESEGNGVPASSPSILANTTRNKCIASSNKCHASSNKCLTSSNKKLLVSLI